jgi:predicted nucleic acid-binding protein
VNAWLADTGAFVAALDSTDFHHARVAAAFRSDTRRTLWTTVPVLTEALHLLGDLADAPGKLLDLLRRTRTKIEDVADWDTLEKAVTLMRKYADVPMDFADASLVLLAGKVGVHDILTTDESGFRVFRIQRRRAFHLVLDDFPG